MKILVADNDPRTIESVGICLSQRWPHGEMLFPENSDDLLRLIEQEAPDLVVLDSQIYQGSGCAICREIRTFSAIPLIMVVPGGDDEKLVRALEIGADDCIDKPIRAPELLARMVALLRRAQKLPLVTSAHPYISGDLFIDFDTNQVRIDGEEVKLTFTEFEILRCLVNNSRRVMSHSQLTNLVWGEEGEGSRNALKVHIQHLRNKLRDTNGRSDYILNERGYGYKFSAP